MVHAIGCSSWLLQHDTYKTWAGQDRGLIWITGHPGSGKSTLVRYALDHTEAQVASGLSTRALVVSFFFHGRGTDLQKTRVGLYRSLLHQILLQVPNAAPRLLSTYTEKCKTIGQQGCDWQWRQDELWASLVSSVEVALRDRTVWLFLDALDECGEDEAITIIQDIKGWLQGLPPTDAQFHICLSCRHCPILELDYGSVISVETENGEDITTFVRNSLLQLEKANAPSTIQTSIIQRADGLFLWASLVVKQVTRFYRRGDSWMKIEEEINKIPAELHILFQSLLEEMDEPEISLKLFQWVCYAERPLSLDELRWAIVLDSSQEPLQQRMESLHYIDEQSSLERKLRTASRGLVEVINAPPPGPRAISLSLLTVELEEPATRVQFIHQSVKDFFVDEGLRQLRSKIYPVRSTSSRPNAEGIAHYDISRACIRYWEALSPVDVQLAMTLDSNELGVRWPFLQYATKFWGKHARRSEIRGISQHDLLEFLAWPSPTQAQLSLDLDRVFGLLCTERVAAELPSLLLWYLAAVSKEDIIPAAPSLVRILAQFELVGPLELALSRLSEASAELDARDDEGHTALYLAAREGNDEILRLLLAKGANANSRSLLGLTPLSAAVEGTFQQSATLLLRYGADANVRSSSEFTSLTSALQNGVGLLCRAVEKRSESMVRALPKQNAHPNERDRLVLRLYMQPLRADWTVS